MAGNGEVISAMLRDEWVTLGRPAWMSHAGMRYRCRVFTIPLHRGPRMSHLFNTEEAEDQPPTSS
jgi:hypothetical protein